MDSEEYRTSKTDRPVLAVGCSGMGDTLCSTPTIRKLFSIYKRPIDVYTYNPEVFKNSPFVNEIIDVSNYKTDHDFTEELSAYNPKYIHSTFMFIHHQIFEGVTIKHNLTDIRQFHASFLGFDLLPEERDCNFFPNQKGDFDLPSKYIVLHPSETWLSRSWSKESWQQLSDELAALDIPVVLVGKDSKEYSSVAEGVVKKPVYVLDLKNGYNYQNTLSLSDTWHVLNEAAAVVTMDSGILHLAGTTETHIIQLGSSLNPKLRAPYRFGNQKYKYSYVPGTCNLMCGSSMEYGLRAHGTIHGVPELVFCLENKPTFECHPGVKNVVNEIKKVYI